jgi:multiple sugar transport system substrate-binding protein
MTSKRTLSRREFLAASGGALAGMSTLGLAGCGGSGADKGSMTVLAGQSSSFPVQQERWLKQIGSQLQEQTGVKVSWDFYASAEEEQQKIQTAMTSGTGPDFFILGSTFVPTAQATNGYVVLTDDDWKKVGGKDRLFQRQFTMAGVSPDKLISVPFVMRPFGMVYNTEHFEKAGISSPPKTWNEFVEDAQKMTDPGSDVYGAEMTPADSYDPWKIVWTFVRQMGGDFVSKDLKTSLLDTPDVQTGTKFWFDWATKYKIVDPNAVTWEATDALAAFANGKVGMLIMITSNIDPTLHDSKVKGKYAYTRMPTIPYGMQQIPSGGEPTPSIVSGDYAAVASYSSLKEEALELMKLMTDTENQIKYFEATGDLPCNTAALQELRSKETVKTFADAEQEATPTPFTGAFGPIELVMGSACSKLGNRIATDNYSPSDVKTQLEQANKEAQKQLEGAEMPS